MRRNIHVALASLGLLLGTAGCNGFLTGDKLTNDPNQPSSASIAQLFVAVQAGQFAFQEGTVPMMICMWVQACGGTNGRFVEQAGRYVFGESSNIAANNGDWALVYDAGGLVDIRQVENDARSVGDSTWLGIAKIWEALTMGTASDQWGNIPYSQATASSTPPLDSRFAVLDSVQKLLDQAIAELTNGAGNGPGGVDLVFGGDRTSWIKTAWTLKARYYMHTAESLGTTAYTNAINAAGQGISDATGASDLRAFHSGAGAGERNMWGAFQESSSFGQDLVPGKFLVDLMNARSDPRLPAYFCKTASNTYVGQDFNNPIAVTSTYACQPLRFGDLYRMPFVSYAENELILAEANSTAKVNGGGGGDDAAALLHLNNERAYVNATYPATAGPPATVALPALAGITGAALFDSIMVEKYVAMFQNMETINDYRRTCIPAVTLVTNNQGFSNVPGRLFYPRTERNVNSNVPDPSAQLSAAGHFFRNPGDVAACTASNAP
jgi:starch-binding outer membrane protein, SusD/RagB family